MRPEIRSMFQYARTPVNLGLIAALVVTFLLAWAKVLPVPLAFDPAGWQHAPWGWVTYPLSPSLGVMGLLFAGLWLFQCGAMVERQLGPAKYGLTMLILSTLSALCVYFGYLITNQAQPLGSPMLWLAYVTIMWATQSPLNSVLVMGVFPVQARWLGWVSAALVFFGTSPQLALFSAIPLVLAWAFAANKLPIPYGASAPKKNQYAKSVRETDQFYADADRRKTERDERERLRKLFESSLDEDPPKT